VRRLLGSAPEEAPALSGEHAVRRAVHRIVGMHKRGFSDRKIAKRTGLPVEAVRDVLRKGKA
jgi:hypothetical protein